MKKVLIEIVRKECERYWLIEFGLLASVEEGVNLLIPYLDHAVSSKPLNFQEFEVWRKSVLAYFYEQLDYKGFLHHHKQDSAYFHFLFTLQKRLLQSMFRENEISTLDKSLAIPPRTIAFKLSNSMAMEQRMVLLALIQDVKTPIDVEKSCLQFCRNLFPLQLKDLLMLLRKDDSEFWDELCFLIRRIARTVTNRLHFSIRYKEEIEQDTWEETLLFIRRKLLLEKELNIESATHLRNYLTRVCINKYYESERSNRGSLLTWDTVEEMMIEQASGLIADSEISSECVWNEIDPSNKSEVSRALAAILWDKEEPYYSRLVKGIEDKVEVLRLHYIEGKSYEDIAKLQAGGGFVPLYRLQAKLRQDVVRVRKTLKERFDKMLMESQ